jgi:hypothetical protein
MKYLFPLALLTALSSSAAFAATGDDCDKSWKLYDVSGRGRLSGAEATKFADDMKAKGVIVGQMKNGTISAAQYRTACVKDLWATFEDEVK